MTKHHFFFGYVSVLSVAFLLAWLTLSFGMQSWPKAQLRVEARDPFDPLRGDYVILAYPLHDELKTRFLENPDITELFLTPKPYTVGAYEDSFDISASYVEGAITVKLPDMHIRSWGNHPWSKLPRNYYTEKNTGRYIEEAIRESEVTALLRYAPSGQFVLQELYVKGIPMKEYILEKKNG